MTRVKMSREERAKQFMPFAALKGYPDALRKKEKIIVSRMELPEEYGELLDRKLHQVKRNDMITVVYFHEDEYVKRMGMVSGIDGARRVLKLVDTKIRFDDIYEIYGDGISTD